MHGHTLANMSLTLIVALCDTTLYVFPLSGGEKVPVHLKKFDCLIMRGDVGHIGAASEYSQTEILHIYLDSPFPGCQREMMENGLESATFPFLGSYPTAQEIAKEQEVDLGEPIGRGCKRVRK